MPVLAPGSILQLMFLKKELESFKGKTFLEVGPGAGNLSQMLLRMGLKGSLVELSKRSCDELSERFADHIEKGNLKIENKSFLSNQTNDKYDLVISSMVLEHLDEADEKLFIQLCEESLAFNGTLMLFVPANPKCWGLEDEIAGHFRRYSKEKLADVVSQSNLDIELISGLTYPLSNILLPISNLLVKRAENSNLELTMEQRTLLSGHRDVMFKTVFPGYFSLVLNRYMLYPFYVAQIIFRNNSNSLVLFLRAKKTC
jgi:phospholipid N-methyltransferase